MKNLYPMAIKDPEIASYLPPLDEKKQRLPERDFFFGIMASIKKDFLEKIIREAHLKRFKSDQEEEKRHAIKIKDSWLDELMKYPVISSKN